MKPLTRTLVGGAALGVGALAYSLGYERTAFTVRRVDIPVLPPGARPVKVLHLSDVHLTPGQRAKQRWIRELIDLDPDLVVNTGDNLAHLDSVAPVLSAYRDLLDVPGVFVFGSNDYFSPIAKNPLRYLWRHSGGRTRRVADLPWRELRDAFTTRGWLDLDNASARLKVGDLELAFAGVDDPHLEYDDLGSIESPAPADADLAIGVAHAPYLRVLDAMNTAGYPVIFAGHTHGGQVRLPYAGALVTNCDLDRARARGLNLHATDGNAASWLHVSAGLGTSPFAPIRFCCRPEATLATLTPIDSLRWRR
ncbi:metallophosphoesterase [Solicola gregarius]|uniref:Metallophosphoesterase n=1 Tax=Solicola gregarius TaxID=2908642 RepID=A0AA46TLY4_9ACTN|nr:metallophosphoesterase [Solicola gregarius]UYM07749.1 metallophosphoesterase [Solicola gregarius]